MINGVESCGEMQQTETDDFLLVTDDIDEVMVKR